MPQGVGGLVYLSDESENVSKVSTAGRAFFSDSYDRIKNHSPINVSSASGGSHLESVPVGRVYLRSESGNSIMWWGGTGEDAPYSGHGFPLYGGEISIPIHVTNFSSIQIVSAVSGQIVYPIGFLNGSDVTLSNTTPIYPDITAPFIISNSPVSGLSGVSLDSDISVRFNEVINPSSVVSGVFRLSPAHNVTIFRDTSNPTDVVLRPNVNLSGTTVYFATLVSGTVTDLNGNVCTSGRGFPFTTTNAPPPPDVIAPTVSGITPVSGAQSVAVTISPVILFSEQMLSGTINTANIYMASTSGATSPGDITSTVTLDSGDRKTVTVNPISDLTEGQTYYLNITTGVQDLATNAMASPISNHPFSTNYNFQEVYNVLGVSVSDAYNGDVIRWGIEITGSCTLIDAPIKKVTWQLRKVGSPTGTAYTIIRDSAGILKYQFTQTLDVSTLTTTFQDVSFVDLNNTYTMVNGDRLLIEWDGGNSSNKIEYSKVSSNVYNNARYITWDGSTWNGQSQDITAKVYK